MVCDLFDEYSTAKLRPGFIEYIREQDLERGLRESAEMAYRALRTLKKSRVVKDEDMRRPLR